MQNGTVIKKNEKGFGFIKVDGAPEGAKVAAVHAGKVAFSDWLRGFGNLLIIDHGDAYMSLYGNNESLYRQVGDLVHGGDTVATVGNSGGNTDSGLYFELRYQGKPLDPLGWVGTHQAAAAPAAAAEKLQK